MDAQDLFVAVQTPVRGTGQALRVATVLRALADTGRCVHVLHVRFGGDEPAPELQAVDGLTFEAVDPSRGAARALTYALARGRRLPAGWARAISPELVSAARARAKGADRVIADGPGAAAALLGLAKRRPVIYNAHNLESAYRHTLADNDLGSPGLLRNAERRLLATFAESWMVSEVDLAGARELCPTATLRLVPNVVDIEAIPAATADPHAQRILMVADYTYEPNANGLRFLVDEVMPRVWTERPEATLRLVGRGLPDGPYDPRVQPAGFVDDLNAEYAAASCAVVPLLEGGGTPFKFLEAMAHGLPVVATPRAAAGLAVRDGEHYLEGEDAQTFAGAIIALTGENADTARLAAAGRALVADRYSMAALRQAVAV
ncbi:glycosyltransferase [Baekduia sp. Peel2402]|uniref:glycosyltransferase n=1 Tax=Baekduia sp. Peel2402 TaxID=3458296 RepID=UPI00403E6E2D